VRGLLCPRMIGRRNMQKLHAPYFLEPASNCFDDNLALVVKASKSSMLACR
jgi:hypothetical protein